jgi:hypothetical protein
MKSAVVSLATGIAVKSQACAPTIEIVVAGDNSDDALAKLIVNGTRHSVTDWYEDEYYEALVSDERFIFLKKTNIEPYFVDVGFRHCDLRVSLPQTYANATANACGLSVHPTTTRRTIGIRPIAPR